MEVLVSWYGALMGKVIMKLWQCGCEEIGLRVWQGGYDGAMAVWSYG